MEGYWWEKGGAGTVVRTIAFTGTFFIWVLVWVFLPSWHGAAGAEVFRVHTRSIMITSALLALGMHQVRTNLSYTAKIKTYPTLTNKYRAPSPNNSINYSLSVQSYSVGWSHLGGDKRAMALSPITTLPHRGSLLLKDTTGVLPLGVVCPIVTSF